jgi:hypothetical protein
MLNLLNFDCLLQISFILLINAASSMDIKEFTEAFEKLDENTYSMIDSFYFILSRNKLKLPTDHIGVYEEFLCSTQESRRSLSKQ